METIQVKVVELVSPIVLSETNNSNAEAIVKVNGKDRKASIRKIYEDGKDIYKVHIEGLEKDTLETLGIQLDTNNLLKAHAEALAKRLAEIKIDEDRKATIRYKQWQNLAKSLDFKMNSTLEDYLKRPSYDRSRITISKEEVYKSIKITVYISTNYDGWYVVNTGYSREQNRKTKISSKLPKLVEALLASEKKDIDYAIDRKNKLASGLKKGQELFGKDITQGEYYYISGRKWCYAKCLELSKGTSYSSPKVQFIGDDNQYTIKKLDCTLTTEEVKQILDIIRSKKEVK